MKEPNTAQIFLVVSIGISLLACEDGLYQGAILSENSSVLSAPNLTTSQVNTPSQSGPGVPGPSQTPVAGASCLFDGSEVSNGQAITVYQNETVPDGQSCHSENRTCRDGVLSGNFQWRSCSSQLATLSSISQPQNFPGDLTVLKALPALNGNMPTETAVCNAGLIELRKNSLGEYPILEAFDYYSMGGTLGVDVNAASGVSGRLSLVNARSEAFPVTGYSNATNLLRVESDITVKGELHLSGLMIIAAGATVNVESGKFSLGKGGSIPGLLWIKAGGKLLLGGKNTSSIGVQTPGAQRGLVIIESGATVKAMPREN